MFCVVTTFSVRDQQVELVGSGRALGGRASRVGRKGQPGEGHLPPPGVAAAAGRRVAADANRRVIAQPHDEVAGVHRRGLAVGPQVHGCLASGQRAAPYLVAEREPGHRTDGRGRGGEASRGRGHPRRPGLRDLPGQLGEHLQGLLGRRAPGRGAPGRGVGGHRHYRVHPGEQGQILLQPAADGRVLGERPRQRARRRLAAVVPPASTVFCSWLVEMASCAARCALNE